MGSICIELPDYAPEKGLVYSWDHNFEINVEMKGKEVVIKANQAGLVSLAKQLLTLAQNDVPAGSHFHYDEENALEEGSLGLIISKIK